MMSSTPIVMTVTISLPTLKHTLLATAIVVLPVFLFLGYLFMPAAQHIPSLKQKLLAHLGLAMLGSEGGSGISDSLFVEHNTGGMSSTDMIIAGANVQAADSQDDHDDEDNFHDANTTIIDHKEEKMCAWKVTGPGSKQIAHDCLMMFINAAQQYSSNHALLSQAWMGIDSAASAKLLVRSDGRRYLAMVMGNPHYMLMLPVELDILSQGVCVGIAIQTSPTTVHNFELVLSRIEATVVNGGGAFHVVLHAKREEGEEKMSCISNKRQKQEDAYRLEIILPFLT